MKPPTCRRHRFGWLILAVAAVGLFGGGLALFGDRPKSGIRVERLEADLNERLPDGSSWEQAEAWFASHGIQPHGIITSSDNQKVGLGAIVPNDSFLQSAEIRIYVYFGPAGRLTKRSIYRFVYSL